LVKLAEDVGVPVMAPVDALIANPDGRDGEIVRVIGEVPPLTVTGINEVAATDAVRVWLEIARVVESAAETVSAKVLELVAPLASVAVTVKLVEDEDDVGVPVMAPVEVFIVKPEGRDGETARVIGDVPPLAVTGINEVAAALAVKVWLEVTSVEESAVETVKANVFALVAPLASVAVTVKLVEDKDDAGVPVMAPVEEFIDSPDGSDGEIARVIGDVPPLAVTGINAFAAVPAVNVSDAIARVVVRAAETVREKVLVALPDAASVIVTV
jgi:hypothetical protein